jgi:uncharacterized membrane protein YoaK (UPF0700 family)
VDRNADSTNAARALPGLLLALTFATGLIDAISYLGLDRVFVANMTGNLVLLGFGLAGADELEAIGPLIALGGFIVGAFLGGRLAHRWGRPRRRWLALAFSGQLLCVALATFVAILAGPVQAEPVRLGLVLVLGVGMGVQTATARALAVPDLNTAVITITLTGLMADLHLGRETVPRPGRRMLAIVALLLGALVGALVIVQVGLAAALALTLVVLLAASVGLVWVAEDDDGPPEGSR